MTSFLGRLKARGKKLSVDLAARGDDGSNSPTQNDSSDLGVSDSIHEQRSLSLAYNLDILLADASALSFFIQFLESCDKLNLIKFWMHVEGFRSSLGGEAITEASDAAQSLARIDATNIFEKYLEEKAVSSIALPKKIRDSVKEYLSSEVLTVNCFDEAQLFVRRLFELRYFGEFQSSVYYKKHELDVLGHGCTLKDILHIQTLLQSFMELLSSNCERSRVQFLIVCESFENEYPFFSQEQAMDDAMVIYDKYLSMQAPSRLDISDACRISIESAICTENGRPSRLAFRPATVSVYRYLEEKYLAVFTSGQFYRSYVEDLRVQIDNVIELPVASRANGARASRGSVASSSDSLSFVFKKHCENLERCQDLPLPSDWPIFAQSPRNSRLAEVDNLGRYRALYDDSLSQDGTPKSKLRLKLRQYLDKSSLREEEIAEEVAKTIIADVQSMVEAGRRG